MYTTWQAFTNFDTTNSEHLLVRYLRFPRTLLAIVIGVALGGAGTLMQALTRNPLADPGLFGINAGAMVAIVSVIALTGITDVTIYMWFGLLGAFCAGVGVYLLGGVRHGLNPVRMVLAGVALSVVLLAITQLITVNSDERVFDQFRHWVVGSLQGRSFDVLYPITVLVVIGSVIAYSLTRSLDIVTLGDDISHALGANQKRVWLLSAFSIVLLAGFAIPLKRGVDTFRVYVEGWYEGSFQDVIYYENASPEIRRMISSILAGYAWDGKNPYVSEPRRRLRVLAELCSQH